MSRDLTKGSTKHLEQHSSGTLASLEERQRPDASVHDGHEISPGQWFWVRNDSESTRKKGEPEEWLGCVLKIGSNHVEVHEPSGQGTRSVRLHSEELGEYLRPEPNPEAVIAARIAHHQERVKLLMGQVQALTEELGLHSSTRLAAPSTAGEDAPGQALAVLSSQFDVKAYKTALVRAEEETLPELFKAIEGENKELARWMTANTLPLRAQLEPLKGAIHDVKDRIFNVSLYAGLAEDAVQCHDGAPAAPGEKLHVMQRRLYMDEECLLNYEAGGMEFKDIESFDAWLSRPENRDRVLPFPRTLVAMKVRRHEKERNLEETSLLLAFIRMLFDEQADKSTFLYVRNGEQLWRINCEMEFGELIFPEATAFDLAEPKMVRLFAHRPDGMISRAEFEARVERKKEIEKLRKAWAREHPDAHEWDNPHRWEMREFSPSEWRPLDQSNVYFDECMEQIANSLKEYNRIALIIQGLFDRSPVLHPHRPVRSWTPEGFAESIELVYDGVRTLANGVEAPDFEAYRARCNASLGPESIVTGQEDFWKEKEAQRANAAASRRGHRHVRYHRYAPYGDPGPGLIARMVRWQPRARLASFAWTKESVRGWKERVAARRLVVPADRLLNVSAYQPGDYKQFFQDGRTRAQYLKWAPLMLAAEDYLAGKIACREPETL